MWEGRDYSLIKLFILGGQGLIYPLGFFSFFGGGPKTVVYGDSQARGPIGATAAGLHHSHSNAGSELCLRPIPQLMATPDP